VSGCTAHAELQRTSHLTVGPPLRLARVVVVALSDDEAARRKVEESFVAALGAARAVPSHQVIEAGDEHDAVLIKRRFAAGGFDGALLVRVVASNAIDEVPGSWSYPDMGGWEGAGTPRYTPGVQSLRESLRLEVEVYSLRHDALAWRGASSTSHPSQLDRLAGRVARAVALELEKLQVIQERP